MPLTLYWYILRDVLKLLGTAAAVLVIVMSFGFTIKPISEGLLGPVALMKVLLYTMPGMLAFAMPFAAAFASTMVFFRLSQDNEITACAVSGVSYREMLTPVLVLGLVLTLLLFWLSNWIVPKFWRLVAQEVEQDASRLVIRKIQRGQTVDFGRLVLYADRAEDHVKIPGRKVTDPMPYNTMVLDGVAVAKIDPEHVLQADYTAERAVVDLYRDPEQDRIYATMMLSNVTINDPTSGTLISVARQPIEPQEIESPFQQSPKFMSLPRLKQLQLHPERSRQVRKSATSLIDALASAELNRQVQTRLAAGKTLTLLSPQGQRYLVTAPEASPQGDRLALSASGNDKIIVRARTGDDLTTQRIEAEAGSLEPVTENLADEPRMNLKLDRVHVIDQALPTPATLRQVTLPLLHMDEPVLGPLRQMTIPQLISRSSEYSNVRTVERWRRNVQRQEEDLWRDILSRVHERAAIAVNCLLVVLLGAVMSMTLRHQTPLAIFFWCFVPTIVAFVMITTGQNMIGWHGMSPIVGMATVWSGNVALVALILGVYTRLCRN